MLALSLVFVVVRIYFWQNTTIKLNIDQKGKFILSLLAGSVLGFVAGIRVLNIASAGGGMATGTALVSILLLIIGAFSVFTGIILNVLTKRRS